MSNRSKGNVLVTLPVLLPFQPKIASYIDGQMSIFHYLLTASKSHRTADRWPLCQMGWAVTQASPPTLVT